MGGFTCERPPSPRAAIWNSDGRFSGFNASVGHVPSPAAQPCARAPAPGIAVAQFIQAGPQRNVSHHCRASLIRRRRRSSATRPKCRTVPCGSQSPPQLHSYLRPLRSPELPTGRTATAGGGGRPPPGAFRSRRAALRATSGQTHTHVQVHSLYSRAATVRGDASRRRSRRSQHQPRQGKPGNEIILLSRGRRTRSTRSGCLAARARSASSRPVPTCAARPGSVGSST